MHVKTAANISFPKFIGRRFFDKFSVTSYFLHVNAKCFDNFLCCSFCEKEAFLV